MAKKKFNYLEAQTFEQDEQGRYYIHSASQRQFFKERAEAETKIRQANQLKQQIQDETNTLLAQYAKEKQGFERMAMIGNAANPVNWAKGLFNMVTANTQDNFVTGSKAIGESNAATNLFKQSSDIANEASRIAKTDKKQSEALLRQSQALFNEATKFQQGEANTKLGDLTPTRIATKSVLSGLEVASFLPIGVATKATSVSANLATKVPATVPKLTGRANLISNAFGLGDIYQAAQVGVQQGLKKEITQTVVGQAGRAMLQAPLVGTLEALGDQDEDNLGNIVGSIATTAAGAFGITLGLGYAGKFIGGILPTKAPNVVPEPTPTSTPPTKPQLLLPDPTRAYEGQVITPPDTRIMQPDISPESLSLEEIRRRNLNLGLTSTKPTTSEIKIPKGQEKLYAEAVKYDNVDDFVKAQKPLQSIKGMEVLETKSAILENKDAFKQFENYSEEEITSAMSKLKAQKLKLPNKTVVDGYNTTELKAVLEGKSVEKGYNEKQLIDIYNKAKQQTISTPTQDPIKENLGAFDPETSIPMLDLTKTVKGNNIDFNPDSAISVNSARKAVDDLALLSGNQVGGKSLNIDQNDPKYKEIYNAQIKPLVDRINAVDDVAPAQAVSPEIGDEITIKYPNKNEAATYKLSYKATDTQKELFTKIYKLDNEIDLLDEDYTRKRKLENLEKEAKLIRIKQLDFPKSNEVKKIENQIDKLDNKYTKIWEKSGLTKDEFLDTKDGQKFQSLRKELSKNRIDEFLKNPEYKDLDKKGDALFDELKGEYRKSIKKRDKYKNLLKQYFDTKPPSTTQYENTSFKDWYPYAIKQIQNYDVQNEAPQVNKIPVEDVELELNQIKATLQNEGFKTEPEKVAYTPNIDKVDEKLAKGETPTPEEFDAGSKEYVNNTGNPEVIEGVKQELNKRRKEESYYKTVVADNPQLQTGKVIDYEVANLQNAIKFGDELVNNDFDKALELSLNMDVQKIHTMEEIQTFDATINKLLQLGRNDEAEYIITQLSKNLNLGGQQSAGIMHSRNRAIKTIMDISNERQRRFDPEIKVELEKVKKELNNVVIDKDAIIEILDNITCQ